MEAVADFIFLGSKITVDSDCSRERKRRWILGRKSVTNLDRVFKSWDITWLTNVCLVKAMFFPVVMYRCESWTTKKAKCQRIDAFGTVVLERTLDSPLDSKEIIPVSPKENQPWIVIGKIAAEAEAPIPLPPDERANSLEKDPDASKDWR